MLDISAKNLFRQLAALMLGCFIWCFSDARAEGQSTTTAAASPSPSMSQQTIGPLYTNYRGVRIGMSVDEAREKLGKPKSKGTRQDFYVFSKNESAEVFYLNGKVSAVSVDYVGGDSGAPTPVDVFGTDVKPMKSGRVYKLVRYPKAGYWGHTIAPRARRRL